MPSRMPGHGLHLRAYRLILFASLLSALMTLQIISCLADSLPYTELNFDSEVFAALYYAILKLIARVDASEYHGTRFRQMLKEMTRPVRSGE